MLIQLGWLAFFQYSLLMKQNNKYSISAPARIGNTITKKGTLPSMKRTGCQKLHIMKI